jgi:hypothetical protein
MMDISSLRPNIFFLGQNGQNWGGGYHGSERYDENEMKLKLLLKMHSFGKIMLTFVLYSIYEIENEIDEIETKLKLARERRVYVCEPEIFDKSLLIYQNK